MNIEYKIIYRIGGDIPINPGWIGDQLQDAVDALQEKINEKKSQRDSHARVVFS